MEWRPRWPLKPMFGPPRRRPVACNCRTPCFKSLLRRTWPLVPSGKHKSHKHHAGPSGPFQGRPAGQLRT
eukprot:11610211-Alexandrium_andersonii.AAC.1